MLHNPLQQLHNRQSYILPWMEEPQTEVEEARVAFWEYAEELQDGVVLQLRTRAPLGVVGERERRGGRVDDIGGGGGGRGG